MRTTTFGDKIYSPADFAEFAEAPELYEESDAMYLVAEEPEVEGEGWCAEVLDSDDGGELAQLEGFPNFASLEKFAQDAYPGIEVQKR